MFRALLAHLKEALHKRHLVYCVRIISVGCYQDWSGTPFHSNPGNRGLSTGVQRSELEDGHSSPSSVEVKNEWRYTSTPPYVYLAFKGFTWKWPATIGGEMIYRFPQESQTL
jgi:hypothetical protein